MNYELHPLCTLFPRMAGNDYAVLVADIRENGLRHPIILHDGMILDGGNRYRACLDCGIAPTFADFDGENLVAFVLSVNLHRRHMTAGQQAAIVASAQDWAKAQPKGGDRKSDQSAALHFDSAADRAAASGSSVRTQKDADKVAKADPALAIKVAHGQVTLPDAVAKVTGKPKRKPKPAAPPPEPEPEYADCGPDESELAASLAAEESDRRTLGLLLAADDKLAAAVAEIKRLNAELAVVKGQRNRFQNQAAEFAQQIKRLKRQVRIAA